MDISDSLEHKIFLKDLDNYFNKTKEWIKAKDRIKIREAKILKEQEPEFIRMKYGWQGKSGGVRIDIEFRFNKDNNSIAVKLINSYGSFDEKYLVRWKPLIEDYYNYIGVTLDDKLLKEIYSPDNIKYIIKVAVMGLFCFSTFCMVLLSLGSYL